MMPFPGDSSGFPSLCLLTGIGFEGVQGGEDVKLENPEKITFWDEKQGNLDEICDPRILKTINYWVAAAVTALFFGIVLLASFVHWSDAETDKEGIVHIYQSGYGFAMLSAGSLAMGFILGKYWKRPFLAIPLICVVGVAALLLGNWLALTYIVGDPIDPLWWRLFEDICLGPFMATITSLVSLSMYRFS